MEKEKCSIIDEFQWKSLTGLKVRHMMS